MFWMLLLVLVAFSAVCVEGMIFQSERTWDRQWGGGAWSYLEQVPVERSRIAVIGGVLIQLYAPYANATVLEVGCGEGAVTEFLTPAQKLGYVGVDVSKEAVMIAKSKRKQYLANAERGGLRFVHAAAQAFEPQGNKTFNLVVFSEVLYYTEHEKILDKYEKYLSSHGIVIISMFQIEGKPKHEEIFTYAQKKFVLIDELEIHGKTKKWGRTTDITPVDKTAFRIEVLRKRT
jgi:2-polyprenyl-3-methyl-5-hydroxy-6-metoxy-1,4-benzoquinol methylase